MARPYQSNIDLLMIAYGVKRAHDALNNTNNDTLQASIILERMFGRYPVIVLDVLENMRGQYGGIRLHNALNAANQNIDLADLILAEQDEEDQIMNPLLPPPFGGFGQQAPAQPLFGGFGQQAPAQPFGGFGQQAPAQPFGGFGQQAPAQPLFGGFGQQAPAQPFGGFGQQAPAQPFGGFGQQAPAQPPFGVVGQKAPAQPFGGFGQQAPAQRPAQAPAQPPFGGFGQQAGIPPKAAPKPPKAAPKPPKAAPKPPKAAPKPPRAAPVVPLLRPPVIIFNPAVQAVQIPIRRLQVINAAPGLSTTERYRIQEINRINGLENESYRLIPGFLLNNYRERLIAEIAINGQVAPQDIRYEFDGIFWCITVPVGFTFYHGGAFARANVEFPVGRNLYDNRYRLTAPEKRQLSDINVSVEDKNRILENVYERARTMDGNERGSTISYYGSYQTAITYAGDECNINCVGSFRAKIPLKFVDLYNPYNNGLLLTDPNILNQEEKVALAEAHGVDLQNIVSNMGLIDGFVYWNRYYDAFSRKSLRNDRLLAGNHPFNPNKPLYFVPIKILEYLRDRNNNYAGIFNPPSSARMSEFAFLNLNSMKLLDRSYTDPRDWQFQNLEALSFEIANLIKEMKRYVTLNIDFHSGNVYEHSVWTALWCQRFIRQNSKWIQGIDPTIFNTVIIACFLHDIGKIGDGITTYYDKQNHPQKGRDYFKIDGPELRLENGSSLNMNNLLTAFNMNSNLNKTIITSVIKLHWDFGDTLRQFRANRDPVFRETIIDTYINKFIVYYIALNAKFPSVDYFIMMINVVIFSSVCDIASSDSYITQPPIPSNQNESLDSINQPNITNASRNFRGGSKYIEFDIDVSGWELRTSISTRLTNIRLDGSLLRRIYPIIGIRNNRRVRLPTPFVPECGNQTQMDDMVNALLTNNTVLKAQQLLTVTSLQNLPEHIRNAYVYLIRNMANIRPIAQGGSKIVWELPPAVRAAIGVLPVLAQPHCTLPNNMIIKAEAADVNNLCNFNLATNTYTCNSTTVEFFLNAITTDLIRRKRSPNFINTIEQYMVHIPNMADRPSGGQLAFQQPGNQFVCITLQEKANGDVYSNLATIQRTIPVVYPISGNPLFSWDLILAYQIQILTAINLLQQLYNFRMGDCWTRNCFIKYTARGTSNVISADDGSVLDLNTREYVTYRYISANGDQKNLNIRNNGMLMKISDFGLSRFSITQENGAVINFNNNTYLPGGSWYPPSTYRNNIYIGKIYMDYAYQVACWIWHTCKFWNGLWIIDFVRGDIDNIREWSKCVVLLVSILINVLTNHSINMVSIDLLTSEIINYVIDRRNFGALSSQIFNGIIERIGNMQFPIIGTVNTIYSNHFNGITFADYIIVRNIQNTPSLDIPGFRTTNVLDYFFELSSGINRYVRGGDLVTGNIPAVLTHVFE